MRNRRPTPLYLSIPLHIAPHPEDWPLSSDEKTRHHRYWPSNDPMLQRPEIKHATPLELGGWALRNCGVQDVIDIDHNKGQFAYHTLYGRPRLPRTVEEIMGCLMLETAGCIPDEAIDPRWGVVRLSMAQRNLLQQPLPNQLIGYQHIHHRHGLIRNFSIAYIVDQPLDHLHNRYLAEEFVDRKTAPDRRRQLGHILLSQQIERAIDPVRDDFEMAAQLELLDPRLNRTGFPMSPVGFVKRHMVGSIQRQEQDLFPKIESMILAEQRRAA